MRERESCFHNKLTPAKAVGLVSNLFVTSRGHGCYDDSTQKHSSWFEPEREVFHGTSGNAMNGLYWMLEPAKSWVETTTEFDEFVATTGLK